MAESSKIVWLETSQSLKKGCSQNKTQQFVFSAALGRIGQPCPEFQLFDHTFIIHYMYFTEVNMIYSVIPLSRYLFIYAPSVLATLLCLQYYRLVL